MGKVRRFIADTGHGGGAVATGVRVVRAAAGHGEELRVLRVHAPTHRQVRHAAVWGLR